MGHWVTITKRKGKIMEFQFIMDSLMQLIIGLGIGLGIFIIGFIGVMNILLYRVTRKQK